MRLYNIHFIQLFSFILSLHHIIHKSEYLEFNQTSKEKRKCPTSMLSGNYPNLRRQRIEFVGVSVTTINLALKVR